MSIREHLECLELVVIPLAAFVIVPAFLGPPHEQHHAKRFGAKAGPHSLAQSRG